MWPESSSVNAVNLVKKICYNYIDIEFFLGDYYFFGAPCILLTIKCLQWQTNKSTNQWEKKIKKNVSRCFVNLIMTRRDHALLPTYRPTQTGAYLEIWMGGGLHFRCTFSKVFIIRPPGTAVPDGLMSYRRCFFCFATCSPNSLDRSPWNFATWSESGWNL